MDTKIVLPKSYCEDEVVVYIASRYKTTPLAVITEFMRHEGILPEHNTVDESRQFHLADNEISICRGLGIAPSHIEVVE
jgi:uncharacterized phage-like protein YoqJ